MTAPASAQPAPLPYAPPAGWHRRRGFRALLGASVLLMLCGSGAIAWRHYAPWLRPRLAMLSAQRACLNYQAPPDNVVLTRGADETVRWWLWFGTGFKKSRGGLPAWEHFHNTYVSRVDEDGSKTLLTSDGTVFLHERRSPGGNRRLVAVDLQMSWHRGHTTFNAAARVAVPGTLRADPETVFSGPATDDLGNPRSAQRRDLLTARYGKQVKFFAGQPDPADASRFTVDYEIDGRRETIDGRLRDDDAVDLLPRNPLDRTLR